MPLTLPSLPAGHTTTAADLTALMAGITQAYGIGAVKTADETVTSNTTLQNDDELAVALATATTYRLESRLYVFGAAAGDIKVALAFPANTTVQAFGGHSIVTGAVTVATSADVEARAVVTQTASPTTALSFGVPDTNGIVVTLSATVVTTSTAGTLNLQWAQNSSSGTGTIVKIGSWLRVWAE